MGIAITEEHRELERTVRGLLQSNAARDEIRFRLDDSTDGLPTYWKALAELDLFGLHLPEAYGGAGYGIIELAIVVQEMGRVLAGGPFLPTVMSSAIIDHFGDAPLRDAYLSKFSVGELTAAVGLDGQVVRGDDGSYSGEYAAVLGAPNADVLLLVSAPDVLLVNRKAPGVVVEEPANLDLTRHSGRLRLGGVPASEISILEGASTMATALVRILAGAEAAGIAQACVEASVAYATERKQFGRQIGMFQAVKHHCANMLIAEQKATAAVWDAAQAANLSVDQLDMAGAMAATESIPAAVLCSKLNLQIHGGIGFTWEHDAHLLLRRSLTLAGFIDPGAAAVAVTALATSGVVRTHEIELPPEAEDFRESARRIANELRTLDAATRRVRLVETGYVQPHWPQPWGIAAGAIEQLVIDDEFAACGIELPDLGITGWVMLTLIQHGTSDQLAEWIVPALRGDVIWCQLFSEPDAGSDAASIRAAAQRVDGGWLVSGQKVWTSDAQRCAFGLATVRTNPDVAKHAGISTFVIDMHAPGVEVRPLREITGEALFNEVFLDNVFVPDEHVVGEIDNGWRVARSTLGNERVSIGSGSGGMADWIDLVEMYRSFGSHRDGAARSVGELLAERHTLRTLDLRRATRAVVGGEPGPEGNVTKLVSAEHGQRATELALELLAGSGIVPSDELSQHVVRSLLLSRAMTIAGGTSEITRNQIGERVLGLPRDPLLA